MDIYLFCGASDALMLGIQPYVRKSKSLAKTPCESYLLAKATPLPSGAYEYFTGPIGWFLIAY